MSVLLCQSNEISEGCCKSFNIKQKNLFLVRRSKKVYAYVNSCPHIGVTLNWLPEQFLDSEGELIQCSTHGALFLIETGECISGPCNGQALTSLQVDERNNSIYLIDSL